MRSTTLTSLPEIRPFERYAKKKMFRVRRDVTLPVQSPPGSPGPLRSNLGLRTPVTHVPSTPFPRSPHPKPPPVAPTLGTPLLLSFRVVHVRVKSPLYVSNQNSYKVRRQPLRRTPCNLTVRSHVRISRPSSETASSPTTYESLSSADSCPPTSAGALARDLQSDPR